MNSSHYSLWDRRLHWLVFILVTVALILIYAHGWSPGAWNFLGIALPHVPVADKAFSKQLENIHGTLGNVLMYLAGAHAAMALAHYFVLRDNTLQRMLPFWRSADVTRM